MSEKGKKNKKKTGLGLAIWILLFLIILIVFLVKQEEIKENFDKSGASALIEKKIGKDIFDDKKPKAKEENSGETVIDLTKKIKKTESVAKTEEKKSESAAKKEEPKKKTEVEKTVQAPKSEEKKNEITLKQPEKTEKKTTQTQQVQSSVEKNQSVQQNQASNEVKSTTEKAVATSQTVQQPQVQQTPVVSNTIKAKICFVAIDSDGPVVRKEVTRSVEKDSPMGDALRMLLAGPSANEEKTGCRSLIPEGTRLLSASVKNGIANLNFSEEFQFNQFGAEGSLAQLMQVVYTATNFSTVKGVQILIEGQKRDYLTEGVWIGSPLSRSSF